MQCERLHKPLIACVFYIPKHPYIHVYVTVFVFTVATLKYAAFALSMLKTDTD